MIRESYEVKYCIRECSHGGFFCTQKNPPSIHFAVYWTQISHIPFLFSYVVYMWKQCGTSDMSFILPGINVEFSATWVAKSGAYSHYIQSGTFPQGKVITFKSTAVKKISILKLCTLPCVT